MEKERTLNLRKKKKEDGKRSCVWTSNFCAPVVYICYINLRIYALSKNIPAEVQMVSATQDQLLEIYKVRTKPKTIICFKKFEMIAKVRREIRNRACEKACKPKCSFQNMPCVHFQRPDAVIFRCHLKVCNFSTNLEPPQSRRTVFGKSSVFQELLIVCPDICAKTSNVIFFDILGICTLHYIKRTLFFIAI